jgi:hypothetical protein
MFSVLTIRNIIPALLFLLSAAMCEAEPESKGGKKLQLSGSDTFDSRHVGIRELRLWRSSSAGYKTLEISGASNQARFRFSGKGGAIGRISRISNQRTVNESVVMTGSLSGLDERVGKYLWGVYGWVMDQREWGDANVRHEIYVIHSLNRAETDPKIGTLDVGGKVYDMHRYKFSSGGYRFKAVARQQAVQPSLVTVDLAPFLSFWKKNGMGDSRYLHEVSWAVELLTSGEHDGDLTLRWQ